MRALLYLFPNKKTVLNSVLRMFLYGWKMLDCFFARRPYNLRLWRPEQGERIRRHQSNLAPRADCVLACTPRKARMALWVDLLFVHLGWNRVACFYSNPPKQPHLLLRCSTLLIADQTLDRFLTTRIFFTQSIHG